MNLTYLAISGGIVLATMLVYALLSWRRTPAQPPPAAPVPVEPELAAEPPLKRKRSAGSPSTALAAKSAPGNPRHDPS